MFLEESACCHYILIFQTVETVGFGLDVPIHTQLLEEAGLYFCSYCHQIVFIELLYKKEMQDFFLQKKEKKRNQIPFPSFLCYLFFWAAFQILLA